MTDDTPKVLTVYDVDDPQTMASSFRVMMDLAKEHGEITVRYGGPSRKRKVDV